MSGTNQSEFGSDFTQNRVIGAKEAAAYCNISLPHWRRLYRTGKAPAPIKLSDRKVGWRIGTLVEFIKARSV